MKDALFYEKMKCEGVAVCGLGGLGSHIATALARAGIGRLHLVDFDKVDASNLHRQQYDVTQIGKYKTEALKESLQKINPEILIRTDTVRITEENIEELLGEETIICEAFDRPEEKAMLVNAVQERYPGTYIVAASGMAGNGPANRIQTRRVTKHFYLCGDGVSRVEEDEKLISARVMLCAAHQAMTVIRLIAGEYEV